MAIEKKIIWTYMSDAYWNYVEKKKLNLATTKYFIKVPSFLLGAVLMQKASLYSFCCISLVTSVFKKVNCRR